MKEVSSVKKVNFGFGVVTSGQRGSNAAPQLIVVTTPGGFRTTPATSKILNIQDGDSVMFISNIAQLDAAIASEHPIVVDFCKENGLSLGTPEATIAIHKEFDQWLIAKGIPEYDRNGIRKTVSERLTTDNKIKRITANYDEALEQALASDNEELKEAISQPDLTKEAIIAILAEQVQPEQRDKSMGSRATSPTGQIGLGVSLVFTDSNIWSQLKVDLGEDATKKNRYFDLNTDDLQTVEIFDGVKTVKVQAVPLASYVDKDPAKKATSESNDSEAEDNE